MATELTKEQFLSILQDSEVTKPEDLAIFQIVYSFEGHKAHASQIGRLLGVKAKFPASPINLQIGRLGKRIVKKYHITATVRHNQRVVYWNLFFNGWSEKQFWIWQLKDNLREALEAAGLTGIRPYSEEIPTEFLGRLFEGAKRTITVNSYERNSKARQECIKHYGTTCSVCSIDFELEYGEIGKGFIHVHHLTRLADIGETYEVDPIKDLRPVCPNCHSMLHSTKETLTIDQLRILYTNADGRKKGYR